MGEFPKSNIQCQCCDCVVNEVLQLISVMIALFGTALRLFLHTYAVEVHDCASAFLLIAELCVGEFRQLMSGSLTYYIGRVPKPVNRENFSCIVGSRR